MAFYMIAAAVFSGDLNIKQYVLDNVPEGRDQEIFGGRIILRKVYNHGAAFNIMEKSPQVVMKLSALLGAVLLIRDVFLLRKNGHAVEKTGMMLLTGGAFSNIYDRIVRGKVVDYFAIKSRWKKLSGLTFNVGDICIAAGAFLVSLTRLHSAEKSEKRES